jgi:hypothetical protein
MVIEKKKINDLLPASYNPRKDLKAGDAEYEKLKRSIEQFGFIGHCFPLDIKKPSGCLGLVTIVLLIIPYDKH